MHPLRHHRNAVHKAGPVLPIVGILPRGADSAPCSPSGRRMEIRASYLLRWSNTLPTHGSISMPLARRSTNWYILDWLTVLEDRPGGSSVLPRTGMTGAPNWPPRQTRLSGSMPLDTMLVGCACLAVVRALARFGDFTPRLRSNSIVGVFQDLSTQGFCLQSRVLGPGCRQTLPAAVSVVELCAAASLAET